tara:strand:- start:1 stop:117 length:117 start_codon:yes stop_codon:yes gene_type:complete
MGKGAHFAVFTGKSKRGQVFDWLVTSFEVISIGPKRLG